MNNFPNQFQMYKVYLNSRNGMTQTIIPKRFTTQNILRALMCSFDSDDGAVNE